MIDIEKIRQIVENEIAESDMFIVDLSVDGNNKITVVIDCDNGGFNIDNCVRISRAIENEHNRDEEDFELQVLSAGLDQPLKMQRQYQKNIGRDVDIIFKDGKKLTAKLISANNDEIEIEYEEMILLEGKKRKQKVLQNKVVKLDTTKSVKVNISFK